VLDIIPTGEALRRADMAFALGYWHWFFLGQPDDLPKRMPINPPSVAPDTPCAVELARSFGCEPGKGLFGILLRLIGADPDAFYLRRGAGSFAPEALADYRRCFRDPATIHAMCEDYRAGVTVDYDADEADRGRRRIACPLLVLWAGRGELGAWYDVLAVWRDWADDVRGRALDCGHYLAEEAPEATAAELRAFFLA
jgi:haloacetate dehalogenase